MADNKNILTLEEAMASLQTDNDFDNNIKDILPAIDASIFTATGFLITETDKNAISLARHLAKIKLRLFLDFSTNPQQDKDRETYVTKQLQAVMQYNEGYAANEVGNDEE